MHTTRFFLLLLDTHYQILVTKEKGKWSLDTPTVAISKEWTWRRIYSLSHLFLLLQMTFDYFVTLVWRKCSELKDVPTSTDLSVHMSKSLKKRGFNFVGPTMCYAFMQAVGMVNDHTTTCFRHEEIKMLSANMDWPSNWPPSQGKWDGRDLGSWTLACLHTWDEQNYSAHQSLGCGRKLMQPSDSVQSILKSIGTQRKEVHNTSSPIFNVS